MSGEWYVVDETEDIHPISIGIMLGELGIQGFDMDMLV